MRVGTAVARAPEGVASSNEREVFLDALRTIALLRMVLWHALGDAWLTYIVAAVPAMFFVTGSLLAKSLRRGARQVIIDRGRRILVPLWVFGAFAFALMATAHRVVGGPSTTVPWRAAVFWVFPLVDPHGSRWEGGYLSSPLWYLRALVWLLLAAPLLLRLVRRNPWVAFALPVAGLAVLEWLDRSGRFDSVWSWRIGDFFLYAAFVMLGFLHRDGRLARLTTRHWLGGAAVAGALSALCITTQPIHDHVVNDSHPAHLLVGLTWLCLFFAARPLIERGVATRFGRAAVTGISQRTMTIYLWHSTAIIASFLLLRDLDVTWPPGGFIAALLALMTCATVLFVLLFGWVEDLANHRARRWWVDRVRSGTRPVRVPRPVRVAALAGLLVLVASANMATATANARGDEAGAARATRKLRVPSQQPKAPVAASSPSPAVSTPATYDDPSLPPARAAALERLLEDWAEKNNTPGIELSVYAPARVEWSTTVGNMGDTPKAIDGLTPFDVQSVTKTFTAALVWRAVDAGLIDVDADLPHLDAAPELDGLSITPRQLLAHTSGLINYRDTPGYPDTVTTPLDAIAASAAQPLQFVPGSKAAYTSTNYLVLGLLLEQVTGVSYDDLLAGLVADAGLGDAPHSGPTAGEPNFSTAGLQLTASQLAHWGVALLRDNVAGLSQDALDSMRRIDPATGLGQGVIGYCPCNVDDSGSLQFRGYGHTGGYSQFQYFPNGEFAIGLNIADSIYDPANRYDAVQDLFISVHDLVVGKTS
jgi:CubicO group peptidase (beta-lactamase class C family)/surface polysaccharide O-acyltransferase-like enzyme